MKWDFGFGEAEGCYRVVPIRDEEEVRGMTDEKKQQEVSPRSWFLYSNRLFRCEERKAKQSRRDTLQHGPRVSVNGLLTQRQSVPPRLH